MKKITIYYLDDAPKPELDLLQRLVGGLIEPTDRFIGRQHTIHTAPDPDTPVVVAYGNECALLEDLTPNVGGLLAVNWPVGDGHIIHGPVVICEGWTRAEQSGEADDGEA